MLVKTLRQLGSSSLKVSSVGLGLAALGRPGYINLGHGEDLEHNYDIDAMQSRAARVLDSALRQGIRYFDVARSYGLAEAFLSYWLKQHQLQPGDVTIGSKWGYTYTAGWQISAPIHEVKDHSLQSLKKQWQETEGLLGKHLNLYQIHSVDPNSDVLDDTEVHAFLMDIKSQGVAIGLTVSGPQQSQVIEQALRTTVAGQRLFDCIQATFNVLEPSTAAVLKLARREEMGVIIKESLANGRLTERNSAISFTPQRHILKNNADRLGTTIDALALAFVLQQPWLDVALSGASSPEQLQSNMQALDLQLDEQALTELSRLAENPAQYWETRARLEWN